MTMPVEMLDAKGLQCGDVRANFRPLDVLPAARPPLIHVQRDTPTGAVETEMAWLTWLGRR
jgi:hypothetical protein